MPIWTCVCEPTRWAWCYTPVIPAVRRLRQEDGEFEASLDYIERTSLRGEEWGVWRPHDLASHVTK